MPHISAYEPEFAAEFQEMTSVGHGVFSKGKITIVDHQGDVSIEYYTKFGVDPAAARRHLVAQIDPDLEERIGELVCKVIGAQRDHMVRRNDDGERDELLDTVRVDIIHALKELFHQEPDLPHEKPDPYTQPAAAPDPLVPF